MENRNTPEVAGMGRMIYLPVAAGAIIHEGVMVAIDPDGNTVEASKTEGLTVCGRAEDYVDNTHGTAGSQSINVKRGVYIFDNETIVSGKVKGTHIMKDCYVKDAITVTADETDGIKAGKVLGFEGDGVIVEIL